MNTITRFDKPTCQRVRQRFEMRLKEVADELGLKVEFNGGKFTDTTYEPKIKVSVLHTPDGKDAAQAEFEKLALIYGARPEDYGRTFNHGRDTYKLIGFQPSRRRFPIRAKNLTNGTEQLFTTQVLKTLEAK